MVSRIAVLGVVREVARHHDQLFALLLCPAGVEKVFFAALPPKGVKKLEVRTVLPFPMGEAHMADLHPFDFFCFDGGKVDVVEESCLRLHSFEQEVEYARKESAHHSEVGVRLETVQAHSYGGDEVHCSFHCGSDGAGVYGCGGRVASVVDAAHHKVGHLGVEDVVYSVFDAAGGRPVKVPPPLSLPVFQSFDSYGFEPHRDSHRHSALPPFGRNYGHVPVG